MRVDACRSLFFLCLLVFPSFGVLFAYIKPTGPGHFSVDRCRIQRNCIAGRTTAMAFYAYYLILNPPKWNLRRFERLCNDHGSDEKHCETLVVDAIPFLSGPSTVISMKLISLSFMAIKVASLIFTEIVITRFRFVTITITSFTLIAIKVTSVSK